MYNATIRMPKEIHQTLNTAVESTGGAITKSEIIRRAVEEYVGSGKLDKDIKTIQEEKAEEKTDDSIGTILVHNENLEDILKKLNTCTHRPHRYRKAISLYDDEMRHVLNMMPDPTPENIQKDLKNPEDAATIQWFADTLNISYAHARVILKGSPSQRVLGWYHLGWVGYVRGPKGVHMYYRLKDTEEIIKESHTAALLSNTRGEPKRMVPAMKSKKDIDRAIKWILSRGEWVSTSQVTEELIRLDRRFSKMITTGIVTQRLYTYAAEKKKKRVDGRQLTYYRGLKTHEEDQG